MSENLNDLDSAENSGCVSRPSIAQVKAVIAFMENHPDLTNTKQRVGMGRAKFKKLWYELANIANSIDGANKSTKGWIKFWADKRRSILKKQKQIQLRNVHEPLSLLELKILKLGSKKAMVSRKSKAIKPVPYKEEKEFNEYDLLKDNNDHQIGNGRLNYYTEADERQLDMIDKLVDIMDQQSTALNQMAQASITNSKAMERIAEASNIQAHAVNRLAGTFDNISATVHDVRNAILGIDYTMKRCIPTTVTQQRQNSNIFS